MRDVSTKLAGAFNRVAMGAAGTGGLNPLLMAAAISGSTGLLATLLEQDKRDQDARLQMAKLEAMLKMSGLSGRKKVKEKESDVDVVGMLMDISDTLFKDESQGQPEKALQAEAFTR